MATVTKNADKQSYFSVLQQRYCYYRDQIVKTFYQQHFSRFDRQIILADCLTALNHSHQAFIDMQMALRALFQSFHYGQRNFFSRLFSPKSTNCCLPQLKRIILQPIKFPI